MKGRVVFRVSCKEVGRCGTDDAATCKVAVPFISVYLKWRRRRRRRRRPCCVVDVPTMTMLRFAWESMAGKGGVSVDRASSSSIRLAMSSCRFSRRCFFVFFLTAGISSPRGAAVPLDPELVEGHGPGRGSFLSIARGDGGGTDRGRVAAPPSSRYFGAGICICR